VQFPKPEITVAYDVDANAAAAQRKTVCEAEASNFGSRRTFAFPALDTFGQQIKVMPGCQWITAGVNPKGFIAIISNLMVDRTTTIQANFKLMVAIAPQPFEQTSSHNCRVGTAHKALM